MKFGTALILIFLNLLGLAVTQPPDNGGDTPPSPWNACCLESAIIGYCKDCQWACGPNNDCNAAEHGFYTMCCAEGRWRKLDMGNGTVKYVAINQKGEDVIWR